MLLTILARMSTDEQRLQLLQRLKKKLSNYNLNWMDIRMMLSLFAKNDQTRFEILQFLLQYVKNLSKIIEIDDYVHLSNECTHENEQVKIRLFEQMSSKLNIRNADDLERITALFRTIPNKQKIQALLRIRIHSKILDDHHHTSFQSQNATSILPPISTSFIEQLSRAPLKRRHSFDDDYQDQSSHRLLTPVSLIVQNEFIQQRDTSSSNSSLSSTSQDNVPIRTHSFMIAIRKTFERLSS